MSRPFAKNTAKSAFAQFKEPLNSSDYILNKKNKYSFCNIDYCSNKKNIYSQSNYINLKNKYYLNNVTNSLDHTDLYINLISKLDLSLNIPIVSDLSGNAYPAIIDTTVVPYLTYNIDPCGNLFGNNICDINNFTNYIVYNSTS